MSELLDEATKLAKEMGARSLFWLPASSDRSQGEVTVIVPLGKGEMRLKLRRPLLILAFGDEEIWLTDVR